jgi:hypothetical protein
MGIYYILNIPRPSFIIFIVARAGAKKNILYTYVAAAKLICKTPRFCSYTSPGVRRPSSFCLFRYPARTYLLSPAASFSPFHIKRQSSRVSHSLFAGGGVNLQTLPLQIHKRIAYELIIICFLAEKLPRGQNTPKVARFIAHSPVCMCVRTPRRLLPNLMALL